MAKVVKHRRGTTVQHASFTGAEAEITVDTTKKTAVVHDATTTGGFPLTTDASLAATSSPSGASKIGIQDTGSYYTGTTVEDALQEASTFSSYQSIKQKLGDFVTVKDYGAKGDGVTNDTAAITAAAASGKAVYFPPGTYLMQNASAINLAAGTKLFGQKSAILSTTVADVPHFRASNISYFAIVGLMLYGPASSTGVTAANNRGAVVIDQTPDFLIADCHFERFAGSGITINQTATSSFTTIQSSGKIINNVFVKGTTAAANPWGTQDSSALQCYQFTKNILFHGNRIYGQWYCGLLVQDLQATGKSVITNIMVSNNYFEGMANYGMVFYSFNLSVKSFADNGSGLARVTTRISATNNTNRAHGFTTGDRICLEGCGSYYNGIWTITVVDDFSFDLDDSAYTAFAVVTLSGVRMSATCSGVVDSNLVNEVLGNRVVGTIPVTMPSGSVVNVDAHYYGMGLYIQSAGCLAISNNAFKKCAQQTNAQSLAIATIGIGQITGPVSITGGYIENSGTYGIHFASGLNTVPASDKDPPIYIGDMTIIDSSRSDIYLNGANNVTVANIVVYAPRRTAQSATDAALRSRVGSPGILVDECKNVVLNNITYHKWYYVGPCLTIQSTTGYRLYGLNLINSSSVANNTVQLSSSSYGSIENCVFDGVTSPSTTFIATNVTYTYIAGCKFRSAPDAAANATVRFTGTCTGTLYDISNYASDDVSMYAARMENSGTGANMHTRGSTNTSGGKTRQTGDTIVNTAPTAGGTAMWVKLAVSSGGLNWERVALTP